MKRLALLTVFFYVCTFAAPPRAQAVAPVALIAAAAVGTAMMSASIGTYYAQNGVMPQYVTATAGAVASAADKIFQPSYLAMGAYSLLTPDSLNTAKNYYVGKAAALGAKIGDVIDFVKDNLSDFPNIASLFNSHSTTSPSTIADPASVASGSIIKTPDGNRLITSTWSTKASGSYASSALSIISTSSGSSDVSLIASSLDKATDFYYSNTYIFKVSKYYYGPNYLCIVSRASTAASDNDPTIPVTPGNTTVDYPGLKDALNPTVPSAVADEIPQVLKSMPASQVSAASETPASVAEESAPPAITQADINAALKANTAAVAQAVAQAAADIAAANPDDAAAQIAATQAALEAAKAAEAAAEAANQPEPEPEPSYPVPSTWYTKTCDLSNGLGSCIDYQQVINATSAFQSTALYQFPNLILQCLGYVEGDGCEYPPKISVDLFTRFSNGPINIDLSPFESVVKVMKFFFSILCLVGTGKATMTLFE